MSIQGLDNRTNENKVRTRERTEINEAIKLRMKARIKDDHKIANTNNDTKIRRYNGVVRATNWYSSIVISI